MCLSGAWPNGEPVSGWTVSQRASPSWFLRIFSCCISVFGCLSRSINSWKFLSCFFFKNTKSTNHLLLSKAPLLECFGFNNYHHLMSISHKASHISMLVFCTLVFEETRPNVCDLCLFVSVSARDKLGNPMFPTHNGGGTHTVRETSTDGFGGFFLLLWLLGVSNHRPRHNTDGQSGRAVPSTLAVGKKQRWDPGCKFHSSACLLTIQQLFSACLLGGASQQPWALLSLTFKSSWKTHGLGFPIAPILLTRSR